MSELTRCNRCTLTELKERRPNLSIIEAPTTRWFPNAVEVFDETAVLIAWFAELTEECACHE